MNPIDTDPNTRRQHQQLAMSINNRWAAELMALADGDGRVPTEIAQGLAAKAAQEWEAAGLDPNDPSAPRAPEGVAPYEPPAVDPAPPEPYSGPSLQEIDDELAGIEEASVVTAETLARQHQLRALRVEAYQAAGEGERRDAAFRRTRRHETRRR